MSFTYDKRPDSDLHSDDLARLQTLRAYREQARTNIKREHEEIARIEREMASIVTPVPVGGFVENDRGKRMRVTKINGLQPWGDRPLLVGVNIKKDGSDGAEGEISWYSWRPVVTK